VSRFFSIPGLRPFRTSGRSRPPLDEQPNLEEFVKSRPSTSHGALGLDSDLDIRFVTPSGEVREHSRVIREVPRSGGAVDAYVESQGSGKKEIHRLHFEPDGARTMRQTENKRVKRVEGD